VAAAEKDHPIHKVPVPIPAETFPSIIALAFQSAAEYTGYTRNGLSKPVVVIIKDSALSQILKIPEDGTARGIYSHQTNTVYLGESIQNIPAIIAAGLLVHEFVHYFQYANGFDFSQCDQRKAAEAQSYKAQDAFLKQFGFPVTWQWPNLGSCESEIQPDEQTRITF